MATATGPQGELLDAINGRLNQPRRSKKKKTGPDSPERFAVEKSARRLRFEAKEPSEYNCNDIELAMRDAWKAKGWKTNPPSFTMRDRKQAKEMLSDNGGEHITQAVQYMIQHWESISRRYRVNGFPSIRVLYGFRHSWIPEAIEGTKHGATAGSEYDAGSDDIESGSWG